MARSQVKNPGVSGFVREVEEDVRVPSPRIQESVAPMRLREDRGLREQLQAQGDRDKRATSLAVEEGRLTPGKTSVESEGSRKVVAHHTKDEIYVLGEDGRGRVTRFTMMPLPKEGQSFAASRLQALWTGGDTQKNAEWQFVIASRPMNDREKDLLMGAVEKEVRQKPAETAELKQLYDRLK